MIDTKMASFMRGFMKAVFIGCYAAFLSASIRHVAVYFNNFEQGQDWFGSFLLAGAFDVTALVTTIGVMFFRKSMPRPIQAIVWLFILAIAGYSFVINWEYAAHYQSVALTMQPTGATMPVYDAQGQLHYVPVMQQNMTLLFLNPLLASGFTIFALIYSIIAEFFGTKPPSVQELEARKTYLEQTKTLLESIAELEQKPQAKTSLIQRAKAAAMEVKEAAKEVLQNDDDSQPIASPNAQEHASDDASEHESDSIEQNAPQKPANDARKNAGKTVSKTEQEEADIEDADEDRPLAETPRRSRSTEPLSIPIKEAAAMLNLSEAQVRNLKKRKRLRSPGRNQKNITLASIRAYQNERQKSAQSARQNEDENPPIESGNHAANAVRNERRNGHQTKPLNDVNWADLTVS